MKVIKNEVVDKLVLVIDGLMTCHKCGNMEIPRPFEKLPNELKIHWAQMPRNSLIIYCKHCDEWDVVKPREKVF